MIYKVPRTQLIKQDRKWSCWYASAQMVCNAKGRQVDSSGQVAQQLQRSPEREGPDTWHSLASTSGMRGAQAETPGPQEMVPLLRFMGLEPVIEQTSQPWTAAVWYSQLRACGAIWCQMKTGGPNLHAVVVKGVSMDVAAPELYYNDPWEPAEKKMNLHSSVNDLQWDCCSQAQARASG